MKTPKRLISKDGDVIENLEGHYLVSECTNADKGPRWSWTRYFTRLYDALAFLRQIAEVSDSPEFRGLYPNQPGGAVQEVDGPLTFKRDENFETVICEQYAVVAKYYPHNFPNFREVITATKEVL